MLSRLSLLARKGAPRAGTFVRPAAAQRLGVYQRVISTTPGCHADAAVAETKSEKTVLDFYKEKAGLSAPVVFTVGLGTFLLSKEIFVINEEALLLALVAGTLTAIVRNVGKSVGDALDAESNAVLENINAGKEMKIQALKDAIANEEEVEKMFASRNEVFEVLKDNNQMRLEIEYRSRLNEVHDEVKKRLDYQVELQNLEQRLEREHIVNWVEQSVIKSITPEQEKNALAQCIKDLNAMSI